MWHVGTPGRFPDPGDAPLLWQVRLDDPEVQALATHAPLRDADLRDLAGRPQAEMRAARRRLARLLLARLTGSHPDAVAIGRQPGGAPVVREPAGWHLSVAGQWPLCLIGVSRRPLGVDIEPHDAPPPPADAWTAEERADLAGAPTWMRLARWTAKEAHAKLFGVAAAVDAADIHTSRQGDRIVAASAHGSSVCHPRCDAATIAAAAVPLTDEAAR